MVPFDSLRRPLNLRNLAGRLTLKPQYPHTNSPNWSPYISLENELREFVQRSQHFPLGDHFIYSHKRFFKYYVLILLGENRCWSPLELKRLTEVQLHYCKEFILAVLNNQWGIQGSGPLPPLFLYQNEARRAEKNFWRPGLPLIWRSRSATDNGRAKYHVIIQVVRCILIEFSAFQGWPFFFVLMSFWITQKCNCIYLSFDNKYFAYLQKTGTAKLSRPVSRWWTLHKYTWYIILKLQPKKASKWACFASSITLLWKMLETVLVWFDPRNHRQPKD